ncbi:MAG: hypothetical protein V4502_04695 [Pseudomonadota bacterium]
MRRLFALIVLALSLAFASGPAFAVPAHDCPMAGSSSTMHHEGNGDCCKPACAPNCAMPCPSMVAPTGGTVGPAAVIARQLVATLATPLHSSNLSGVDPPPRTIIS